MRVLAFAGIGDPARFFNTLRASGIDVVRNVAFADHHAFTKGEIEQLVADARRDGLDAGDDGKGSGAAAWSARDAGLGAGDRAVRGDAAIRGCRRAAAPGDRSAVQGAGQQVCANERRIGFRPAT